MVLPPLPAVLTAVVLRWGVAQLCLIAVCTRPQIQATAFKNQNTALISGISAVSYHSHEDVQSPVTSLQHSTGKLFPVLKWTRTQSLRQLELNIIFPFSVS